VDNTVRKKAKKVQPAFSLLGRVDGVSYQLDSSHDDATQWKQIKVIVEMKNRVSRLSDPPPLYEQIQLVAYMVMLGCSHGDLVQSMTEKPEILTNSEVTVTDLADEDSEKNKELQAVATSSKTVERDYLISRVALNAPPYYHQYYWETVIIPRIHIFRDAVMAVRIDDDMRSCYLLSSSEDRKVILYGLCPYLGT
jgi:hypothetical protein